MPSIAAVSNQKGSGTSLSIPHTVPSVNGRFLIVIIAGWDVFTHTATFGGTPLTLIGTQSGLSNVRISAFQLADPVVGAGTVVITPSTTTFMTAGVFTVQDMAGVRGSLITAASGLGSPTLTTSASLDNDLVLDFVTTDISAQTFTPGAGQTQVYAQSGGAPSDQESASSTKPGAASVTTTWTLAVADAWAMGAVILTPVASGVGGGLEPWQRVHIAATTEPHAQRVVLGGSVPGIEPWQRIEPIADVTKVEPWQRISTVISTEPWMRRLQP